MNLLEKQIEFRGYEATIKVELSNKQAESNLYHKAIVENQDKTYSCIYNVSTESLEDEIVQAELDFKNWCIQNHSTVTDLERILIWLGFKKK